MAMQLKVYVKDHPLIRHWLTVARDRYTPTPLFRTAIAEMSRWLTYEAIRDWLPTQAVMVETPLTQSVEGQVINPGIDLAIVPILRAGLGMLENCLTILPGAKIYHLGLVRDEATLQPSCYLDRLPHQLNPNTQVLILEPMMATGGSIIQALDLIVAKGADPNCIRVLNIICAPPALQKIGQSYPQIQIYSAMIDPEVSAQGWILPGLGDAGDRTFGTDS
ncbi:MAG: uracil phosphoribosyltransferase [Pseudanabaenaceae cyanobacterium bins.68]|nr:uracil phosphoribosyltransferase [Pseudanabaenaceae cyanobacterium bins.68]